jgi:pyruvate/2-oxoglutarate dehydrogenase complex dihydrolipoamide dehydrogenase (E3) component
MTRTPTHTADLCIIGAGSGGLSVAAGAAQLGLDVVLIEKAEMGGDCLNTGCVPSKALLAASKQNPTPDYAQAKDYVQRAIDTIAPHDSQTRFEGLGVTVIREQGKFIDAHTVQTGENIIKANKFVIATGSRALIPPITGLDPSKAYTNETIFNLRDKPDHLLIIGGGPIGLEMALAHRRLGCDVSVFDMGSILPRDDQDNVIIARESLISAGVTLHENVSVQSVSHDDDVSLAYEAGGKVHTVKGSHILIAAGRTPNTDDLGLENASVDFNKRGIIVDQRLRTSQKHIYAIGDVAGGPQFTHIAGYHAGIVIRNICFKIPAKVDYSALPWVTYIDPEVAQVGLTEKGAREKYGDSIRVVTSHVKDNDRAVTENINTGQLKVITTRSGRVIGASMIAKNAGDLIAVWSLAISQKMKIGAIAGLIVPYPTLSEINKRAASAWYTPKLFSEKTKMIVRLLQKLPFY